MYEKRYGEIARKFFLCVSVFLLVGFLYGCGEKAVSGENVETGNTKERADGTQSEVDLEKLTQGEVRLRKRALKDYATDIALRYEEASGQMVFSLEMEQIPASDDAYLYLFELACFEDGGELSGHPVASGLKGKECEVSFIYKDKYLFDQFVPALLVDDEYVPLGAGVYLSNPEALADNQEEYPEKESKKGLLLDPTLVGQELTDLGVKHAIYNIPLSLIMGETTDEAFPTIEYYHEGKKYSFNGAAIDGYDNLFTYLTGLDMSVTAIVLNDWNEEHLEMIHPDARKQSNKVYYYMFNSTDEESASELEAIACFLAERYSNGEHGMIHSWVIANEINQSKSWNYMDTDDVEYYTQEFERAFRIFYQAAKSHYANARVYYSIDHDWNSNGGRNKKYFNAKDVVEAFNEAAVEHGNYNWGLAIHPYPNPLSRVNYWSQQYDKTQDSSLLTIMNLNVLTDFLKQEEYLDTDGEVRSITITELGFSSGSGEKLQAAAFAYCYYIVEANPYIDVFIMNRQTDAPEEVRQGLSFGIYEYDHSAKYIKDVFSYIDTERAKEYTDFMLNILGADSLEEALEWAS